MGAFFILRITFKKESYLKSFIKKHKPLIIVDDNSNSFGFIAWRMLWKPNTIICYLGFMGYEDPKGLKKILKGKIKYFDYIAINDLNSRWNKDGRPS